MPATVEQLGPNDVAVLRTFLSRDPVQNLYLLGLLEEFGIQPRNGGPPFAFYGRFEGRELTAALFVGGTGGLVVPTASPPASLADLCAPLVGKVRLRSAVGEQVAVDTLVRHLCPASPAASRSQRLFCVSADDLGPFTNPTLRLATEADLPQLVPMSAGEIQERLGRDPLAEDPSGFRARVLQRIHAKRTYVLSVSNKLVFKIDVGTRSPFGAELEGLYTVPDERRRGHATLSLGQISRHLLSSLPRLTIRIDDQDPALGKVAKKVGYLAGRAQRLVIG